MVKFNFHLKNGYLEIRYVKPNLGGSRPILGIYFRKYSCHICIYPFYLTFGKMDRVRPSGLTPEEKKTVEELDAR